MIQITIHRKPSETVETTSGSVCWHDYLNALAASMAQHGRQVEIRPKRITGLLALWADEQQGE